MKIVYSVYTTGNEKPSHEWYDNGLSVSRYFGTELWYYDNIRLNVSNEKEALKYLKMKVFW